MTRRYSPLPASLLSAKPPKDLGRLSLSMDPWAISVAEGLRAAFATAPWVAANAWFDQPLLLEAALGALLSSYCDPGGPTKQRIRPLSIFGVLGATITLLLGTLAPWPEIAIPVAGMIVFMTSFARIYGLSAQSVGNLLGVVVALCMGRAAMPDHDTSLLGWAGAAAFLAGSLWTQMIALGVWNIRPFIPAKRAVSAVFSSLADMVEEMVEVLSISSSQLHSPLDAPLAAPSADHDHVLLWSNMARRHRARIRDMIERARGLLVDMRHRRGVGSELGTMLLARLEAADQIFGALIAMSDILEAGKGTSPVTAASSTRYAHAAVFLRRLRPVLSMLARRIHSQTALPEQRLSRIIPALTRGRAETNATLAALETVIQERLRVIIAVQTPATRLPGDETRPATGRDVIMTPLASNLAWSSAMLRHATRTSLLVMLALAACSFHPMPYHQWLIITLIVTLQPHYAMTMQRTFERVAGTLAGGALAGVLTFLIHGPLATAIALFPLAVLALSLRPASYALFIVFLTPMIVLLTQYEQGSENDLHIAAMRALFTVLGGLTALVGNLLLWPSWEPGRLHTALRQSIKAHAHYANLTLSALIGEAPQDMAHQARRQAGLTSNNLEASLSRTMLEPRRSSMAARIEPVMLADTALRRIAGRLSVLHLASRDGIDRDQLIIWKDWIAMAFNHIEARLDATRAPAVPVSSLPPRPEVEESAEALQEALHRIAGQLELMAGIDRRNEKATPLDGAAFHQTGQAHAEQSVS
ncbi:FUSC family protein [Granulibacter bethesdensis]|uniref:Integral membrane protein n=1 Tax=Granulibacter bethesdensis (strain ATCC BAA-1260 / CGDNIH1) TaxID=391165 RepID=Q0BV51_GRABC|nr:FUSC family protein [Granulibacter bethesdensis]ABI61301.1 Integral membrane protein [Granulibacter bethesdensis CGDNIH1]AHJ67415.1 Integral membrane protein [Granulibacter bethesdensis]APH51088.1 Integral membrane protein [Granulibacter bethesdensis]APH63782.1 Integral membrane protein [Granulibacter bethesdensis]